ncbi:hypothetical protein [Symmachiella macrocystis]|uniref:hypothetical protein n=1 Tax=Symmachiella macrocystis TaxID=2527985 RepID=UPI0011B4312A|nr:hypothetical protein [Symmachiella macrocystis]
MEYLFPNQCAQRPLNNEQRKTGAIFRAIPEEVEGLHQIYFATQLRLPQNAAGARGSGSAAGLEGTFTGKGFWAAIETFIAGMRFRRS